MKRIPVTKASYQKIKPTMASHDGKALHAESHKIDKDKTRQASLGGMPFSSFSRPTMLGSASSFYNNSYMGNGGTGFGDVPIYFALLNEQNGGILYYPVTLKEKYEWFRYFYRADAYVHAAINLLTDLPMSRLVLRMPKMKNKKLRQKILKKYETMVQDMKLFDKLHSILFETNVIGNCFPAGHLVMTTKGQIPIEQIRENDMVLSENGEFNPVSCVMRRSTNEYLYEISIDKMKGFPLTPTGEHPIFVLRNGKIECVPAKELTKGDYVSLTHYADELDISEVQLPYWFQNNQFFKNKYANVQVSSTDGKIIVDSSHVTASNKLKSREQLEYAIVQYLSEKQLPFCEQIKDICSKLGYDGAEYNIYHILKEMKKNGVVDYEVVFQSGKTPIERRTTMWKSVNKDCLATGRKWQKRLELNQEKIEISNEFLYLLGYFYGDGWVWNNKRPLSYSYMGIDWLFCKGSEQQYEKCNNAFNKVFTDRACIRTDAIIEDGNKHLIIQNPLISEWWAFNFGIDSSTKKIPLWIEKLPKEKLKHLLAGFLDSDGSVYDGGIGFATVNQSLMSSFFRIGLKCGISFNFNRGKSRRVVLPTGDETYSKQTFILRYNGTNDAFEHSIKYQKNKCFIKETLNDVKKIGQRYFYPIADIKKKYYSGYVYNLQVEKQHTYCVNNVNTHNCFAFIQYNEQTRLWDKIVILPPEEVDVAGYPMSNVSRIQYRPEILNALLKKYTFPLDDYNKYCEYIKGLPEEDQDALQGVDYELVKQLSENNGRLLMDTSPYSGDGDSKIGSFVFHFCEKRHEYQDLGVSPIECVLTPLLMKEHYKHTQLSLASRNMTPRNIITANEIPQDALDDLRDQVDQSMLSQLRCTMEHNRRGKPTHRLAT